MVIRPERDAVDLHMVQLMPLSPRQKIENGLSFWYRPTQVVLEKRSLNDCVFLHTPLPLCFSDAVITRGV